MGEEKRKTAMADEETENPHKLPRLELSHPPSTEEGDATTGDSTFDIFDIGLCEHLFSDSEELDKIARDLKAACKPPTCEHDPCETTSWSESGAAGMMVCAECHFTSCTGEKGDREDPRGHARGHASTHQHWVALWCDEPSKGYCFECGLTLMLGQNKEKEDDYALVSRNKMDERGMAGRNTMPPWLVALRNATDLRGMVGTFATDFPGLLAGDDHVIRRMPNHGHSYMNASLQCLLALGKLRTMILSPDARLGDIGLHLKQLFVETSSGNNNGHLLDPKNILEHMRSLHPARFLPKQMGDSYDFLTSLCVALDNEVEQLNKLHIKKGDALFPTFGNSIFKCELLETISCKCCSHNEVTHHSLLYGLQLSVSSKDSPTRSKPLQLDSTEAKDTVHGRVQTQKDHVPREDVEVPIKDLSFIPKFLDDFGAMEESIEDSHNLEDKKKAQSCDIVRDLAEHMNSPASIEDCLTLFSHKLTNCTNCSKVAADLPENNGSKNVEPIMASTNLNTTVGGDQTELSDKKTSPSERSSDLSSSSVESPSRKPYSSDSHHQVILCNDITSKEVTSGKSCGEKDLVFCSTANEKAESPEGVQEASPSCPTTDLLSDQDIQDTRTQKQGSGKQVNYDHSAQQVAEKQSKQTDGNVGATQTRLIRKLPPVLTIQLQRYTHDLSKLSGHVRFKEILHVGPFMDPSSEDIDNSSYHLVGLIEHRGLEMNRGNYVAYVRASGKQQGSDPSSWVCASDSIVQRVSLEEVLRCEAYVLFYERIDD